MNQELRPVRAGIPVLQGREDVNVILVYRNRYGPAMVFTLPKDAGADPQWASIQAGPFARAFAILSEKGPSVSWTDWANHLTGALPYFESWTVEDVPGRFDLHRALAYVRRAAAARLLHS